MELATDRLIIRAFREDDIATYSLIVADPDVMKFVGGPQTIQEAKDYLDEMIKLTSTSGLGRYAVELKNDGALIGFCGFRPAGKYIDFGYRYSQHIWGQGIGLEAAKAVRAYGVERLQMQNMEAEAAIENKASIKILETLGFKHREELIFDGYPALRYRDIL